MNSSAGLIFVSLLTQRNCSNCFTGTNKYTLKDEKQKQLQKLREQRPSLIRGPFGLSKTRLAASFPTAERSVRGTKHIGPAPYTHIAYKHSLAKDAQFAIPGSFEITRRLHFAASNTTSFSVAHPA